MGVPAPTVTRASCDTNMCSARQAADLAHARFSAARAALVDAVGELAETEAWFGDGAGNLAAWLCARWQISMRSARELVRDAEALRQRPALQTALATGSISVDQCKAIATLSEPDTDDAERWLEVLPFWSFSELEREARKKVARELERKDGGEYLRMEHTRDERYVRGEFQVHPEDGATLLAAVEAHIPNGTRLRDWDRASARALVELAKGATAERPLVLLSVSEEELLAGAPAVAELSSGGMVPVETTDRMLCDASTQKVYKDIEGKLVAIGKMSATIPPSMRRAVLERDHGRCTFPGCDMDRYLDCHHIVPRSEHGPTVTENLTMLCWIHHNLVHEGRWRIEGPAPDIRWMRPDGSPFEPRVRIVLDTC